LPDIEAGREVYFSDDSPFEQTETFETVPTTQTHKAWRVSRTAPGFRRKVTREAESVASDPRPPFPTSIEAMVRQQDPSAAEPSSETVVRSETGAHGETLRDRIASAIAAPKKTHRKQIGRPAAALTPVTTKRPADLIRAGSMLPLGGHAGVALPVLGEATSRQPTREAADRWRAAAARSKSLRDRTAMRNRKLASPKQVMKKQIDPPANQKRETLSTATESQDATGPQDVPSKRPASPEISQPTKSPLSWWPTLTKTSSDRAENAPARPSTDVSPRKNPIATVEAVPAPSRPIVESPAKLPSTLAIRETFAADSRSRPVDAAPSASALQNSAPSDLTPSDTVLRLPHRAVISPTSNIRVVRFTGDNKQASVNDQSETSQIKVNPFAVLRPLGNDRTAQPSTITLGQPKTQAAAPRAVLRIKSNAAAAPAKSGRGTTMRMTAPQEQPSRRSTSTIRRISGN
jgi:hypothetical protein